MLEFLKDVIACLAIFAILYSGLLFAVALSP